MPLLAPVTTASGRRASGRRRVEGVGGFGVEVMAVRSLGRMVVGSTAIQVASARASSSPPRREQGRAGVVLAPLGAALPGEHDVRLAHRGQGQHPGGHRAEHHRAPGDAGRPAAGAVERRPDERPGRLARDPGRGVPAGAVVERPGPQAQRVAGVAAGAAGEAGGERVVGQALVARLRGAGLRRASPPAARHPRGRRMPCRSRPGARGRAGAAASPPSAGLGLERHRPVERWRARQPHGDGGARGGGGHVGRDGAADPAAVAGLRGAAVAVRDGDLHVANLPTRAPRGLS